MGESGSSTSDEYEARWGDLVPCLAHASRRVPVTRVILHLPKTGGSSLGKAYPDGPGWRRVDMPPGGVPRGTCSCGTVRCAEFEDFEFTAPDFHLADGLDRGLAIHLGHEHYAAATWLRDAILASGGRMVEVHLLARPARARLASIFTDYWTMVRTAQRAQSGLMEVSPHVAITSAGYLKDSAHYIDADGRINGDAWFRAFAQYGAGVPFFMTTVFDANVDALKSDARTGRLTITPTSRLDQQLADILGQAPRKRARVSDVSDMPAVADALASARPHIDELARRDAAFDRALATLLRDRSFRPKRQFPRPGRHRLPRT